MINIIARPLITEKSMQDVKKGKFSFLVNSASDKGMIRKAVETQFNVHVVSITTTTQKGRTKRVGVRRAEKTLAPLKKAVVTLKEGEKIDMFDLGV